MVLKLTAHIHSHLLVRLQYCPHHPNTQYIAFRLTLRKVKGVREGTALLMDLSTNPMTN